MAEMQYQWTNQTEPPFDFGWHDVEAHEFSKCLPIPDHTYAIKFRKKPVFVPGYYRLNVGVEQDVFWAVEDPGSSYERVNVTVAYD